MSSDNKERHRKNMGDFLIELITTSLRNNERLCSVPFDFDEWKISTKWPETPLTNPPISYRIQQGFGRLGGAVLRSIHKADLPISGYESVLIYDSFVRSPIPGLLLRMMGKAAEPPLDSNETLALILYQATATSVVGPDAYETWNRANNWVSGNLQGMAQQALGKAHELGASQNIKNMPLPAVFKQLGRFFEEEDVQSESAFAEMGDSKEVENAILLDD